MHQSPHCVIAYLQGVLIYMYTYNLDSQHCNAGGDKQPIWHNIGITYGIIPTVLQDFPSKGKPTAIAMN